MLHSIFILVVFLPKEYKFIFSGPQANGKRFSISSTR